jgi:hypothetical protein
MDKFLKFSLSSLLFLCLLDMPYGFYLLVRFIALIGFALLAYQALQDGRQTELIVYVLLALLFQPIYKIYFGRELWNVVDLIVGIGLIISIFIKPKADI